LYKITPADKYILIIKDLNKTVSYTSVNGLLITDEEYERSNDIKRLARYLIIEKVGQNDSKKTAKNNNKNNEVVESKTFVAGEIEKNPKDVFIKQETTEPVETKDNKKKENEEKNDKKKVEPENKKLKKEDK